MKIRDLLDTLTDDREKTLPHAATVLLRKGDRFLAVSRKNDFSDMGMPGGKSEPGETDEAAARRELKEETGLEAGDLVEIYSQDDGLGFWCVTFTGDFEGEINTNEKGLVRWVTPETLLQGSFGEYNRKVFEALGDFTGECPDMCGATEFAHCWNLTKWSGK